MSKQSALEKEREKIHAALRAAGYPVDVWRDEIQAELAANPTARARPFTTISPPKYGKIKKLRPGFTEFRNHPRHGAQVPRCQASRKQTHGQIQCGHFAIKGKNVCRMHGGAAGSGRVSEQGRANQRLSVTVNGDETVAKRGRRSEVSKQRREMEKKARELGLQAPAMRGPRNGNYEQYARYREALERKAAKLRARAGI